MKKQFLFFVTLIILASTSAFIYTCPIPKDKFLTKHNLYQDYQSVIKQVKEKKIWNKELPAFDTTIEAIINSPFNTKYKIANLKETFEQSPYNWYAVNKEFVPQLAVFYDHPHAIKYLEHKKYVYAYSINTDISSQSLIPQYCADSACTANGNVFAFGDIKNLK